MFGGKSVVSVCVCVLLVVEFDWLCSHVHGSSVGNSGRLISGFRRLNALMRLRNPGHFLSVLMCVFVLHDTQCVVVFVHVLVWCLPPHRPHTSSFSVHFAA